jgi:hypothetical protein
MKIFLSRLLLRPPFDQSSDPTSAKLLLNPQNKCLAYRLLRLFAQVRHQYVGENNGKQKNGGGACLMRVSTDPNDVLPQVVDPFATIPITGTFPLGGTFTGTLNIDRFVARRGVISAVGTLTGTLTNALGEIIGTVTNTPIVIPVTSIQATCEILHLELGPLDLKLLGVMVHLNRLVLDITAQSAPGNLLGKLFCAIGGLLDGPDAILRGIAGLFNQILRIFG